MESVSKLSDLSHGYQHAVLQIVKGRLYICPLLQFINFYDRLKVEADGQTN